MVAPDHLALSNWLSSTGNSFLRLQTFFWSIPAPGSVRSNSQFLLLKSCVCILSRFLLSLILCDPMDCSPSGSSVHGILEWVAMPSSKGSSHPGIKPESLWSLVLAGGFFRARAIWEAHSRTSSRQSHCSGLLASCSLPLFGNHWISAFKPPACRPCWAALTPSSQCLYSSKDLTTIHLHPYHSPCSDAHWELVWSGPLCKLFCPFFQLSILSVQSSCSPNFPTHLLSVSAEC